MKQTCVYIYKKKEKELPVNLEPQNFPRYTLTLIQKKTVSETQNHSNTKTHTHTHKDTQL